MWAITARVIHTQTLAHHIHLINTINLLLWQSDNNFGFFSCVTPNFIGCAHFRLLFGACAHSYALLRCALHMLLKSQLFFHIVFFRCCWWSLWRFFVVGWVCVFDVCIYGFIFSFVVHHTHRLFLCISIRWLYDTVIMHFNQLAQTPVSFIPFVFFVSIFARISVRSECNVFAKAYEVISRRCS